MRFECADFDRRGGFFERANEVRIAVDRHRVRRAPRERFERKHARSAKQIERASSGQILPEPVEERFTDAIGRRSQLEGNRKPNDAAAVAPADDADLLGAGSGQSRLRGIVAEPVESQLCARPSTTPGPASPMFDFFKRKPADESVDARPWSERLKSGLSLSREKLAGTLAGVFSRRKLDDEALDAIETALLTADVGVAATTHIIEDAKERYRRAGADANARTALREALTALVRPLESSLAVSAERPFVIMLAGVNGAGKTTSIGKLAKWLQQQQLSVLLAAGDTFRAAAREQLAVWGARNNIAVIRQEGGDAAAVMFDAVAAARARNTDVVLADTAGRLPTQIHLMDELAKVKRVIAKARAGAPDEVLLVLDANTGQNALAQVEAFDAAIGLTGLILTKLDGSAKGGVVAAIARQHPVPLKFIGVGEGIDDLRPFNAAEFVEALLPQET